jgi:hypothetical protein
VIVLESWAFYGGATVEVEAEAMMIGDQSSV